VNTVIALVVFGIFGSLSSVSPSDAKTLALVGSIIVSYSVSLTRELHSYHLIFAGLELVIDGSINIYHGDRLSRLR
jgi:hypothetical protein